jgi:hypothetical protein
MVVRASVILDWDILNEVDNVAADAGVCDPNVGFDESKPVRSGEEIGDIIWGVHSLGTLSP